jgi:GT2 family glycosyltransferase
MSKIAVVVPNWNGEKSLNECLDSLVAQHTNCRVVVVDNGSTDNSIGLLEGYPEIEVIKHSRNKGFAGGVNAGFNYAIDNNYDYVASFNNDAVADKNWLGELVKILDAYKEVGIATCKLLSSDGKYIDSTGDYYTVWGLPYPRGRGETDINKYDPLIEVFGASGGASIYRVGMLRQIGTF